MRERRVRIDASRQRMDSGEVSAQQSGLRGAALRLPSDAHETPGCEAQKTVGNRVRKHRIKAGMTQQHLADVLGTSKSRLSEIECGKHNLSLRQLGKIAGALHISLEELFEGL